MLNTPTIDRRQILKAAAAAGLASTVADTVAQDSPPALRRADTIRRENAREGARDWQLTRVQPSAGKYRTSPIEGDCSHQSIAAGETLRVFVSTEPALPFTLEIFRMGFYGGAGARL